MTLNRMSLRRLAHLTAVLARHVLAVGLGSLLARMPRLARRLPPAEMPEPERLRSILEELGGTFLKLGQILAAQPDLLPLGYCNALCRLLDRVPPFPYAEVEKVLAEELGRAPTEIFDDFEPRPIAAASIGQVHVAHLRGRKVAVKVQRPTAPRDFGDDVRLMELASGLIRRFRLRRFEPFLEPLSEVIEWTHEELDYRREARFMEQLRLGSRHRRHQRVPEVFASYTTRRVLVMEFFDGVTLLEYLRAVEPGDPAPAYETIAPASSRQETLRRLAEGGFDAERFAAHVVDNFFHQALAYGLYHADLHPANLMILPGNVVGYLDLGITGTLSPYSRRQLAMLTLACTRGDVDGMSSAFHRVSTADAASAERYRQGLARISEDWYQRAGTRLRLRKSFTLVMLDMLALSRRTGAWAQRDVIKYIRSSIALDGLVSRCAPGVDLDRHVEQACATYTALGLPSFSPSRLLAGAADSPRRILDSGHRAVALLERLGQGELRIQAELEKAEPGGGDHRRWYAVAAALVLVFASSTHDGAAVFGFDLLTAQAVLLAAVLGWLVGPLHGMS